MAQLLEKIERELAAGYQRIKMKIKPGWDVDVVRQVRERFPSIKLMADANSAYTLADADASQAARRILSDDDRAAAGARRHHRSRRSCRPSSQTPICLDECIRSAHHAEQAIRLRACGIINIKLGRVGGFREAKRVHDVAQAAGIPVWCGGMLEAGIGRAHNIALSTLAEFRAARATFRPASATGSATSSRPPVETTPRGTIEMRDEPGFGYALDHDFMREITVREEPVG